jgi:hypothetical protein
LELDFVKRLELPLCGFFAFEPLFFFLSDILKNMSSPVSTDVKEGAASLSAERDQRRRRLGAPGGG